MSDLAPALHGSLEICGYCILPTEIPPETVNNLRATLFREDSPGERCLLDCPAVRETALALKHQFTATGHLHTGAVAIQAITFNKTAAINWKVAWHQDLMFPFAKKVMSSQFGLPTVKHGIHYVRPPESVLRQLLVVRVHLDDCDTTNGPLRISPCWNPSNPLDRQSNRASQRNHLHRQRRRCSLDAPTRPPRLLSSH